MLAVFAEFERAIAHERTMAGLQAARARGRMGGRRSEFTDEQVLELRHLKPLRLPDAMILSDVKKRLGRDAQAHLLRRLA